MEKFKKRIIGCICLKKDIAVQSIGFKKYLPIGNPLTIAKNLQNWNVDEILIMNISPINKINYEFVEKLTSEINIPIQYSGSITSLSDAKKLISMGIDKVVLRSILDIKQIDKIKLIQSHLGKQSLVGSLPIGEIDKKFYLYDCKNRIPSKINQKLIEHTQTLSELFSEMIIIDFINDGKKKYNEKLLNIFNFNCNIIPFGGLINKYQIKKLLSRNNIHAIGIGNSLSFKENSVTFIKNYI